LFANKHFYLKYRLIEIQRASVSYDQAYSDEYKGMKKKEKGETYDSLSEASDDADNLDNLYNEVRILSSSPSLFQFRFF
jgi:hypothetical protein